MAAYFVIEKSNACLSNFQDKYYNNIDVSMHPASLSRIKFNLICDWLVYGHMICRLQGSSLRCHLECREDHWDKVDYCSVLIKIPMTVFFLFSRVKTKSSSRGG